MRNEAREKVRGKNQLPQQSYLNSVKVLGQGPDNFSQCSLITEINFLSTFPLLGQRNITLAQKEVSFGLPAYTVRCRTF
jgi:hypothetical protein